MSELAKSTPSFGEFDPEVIPFQDDLIDDVECNLDYGLGVHEILLSGSVGSAKSLVVAHLIVKHCLTFSGAKALIGRRSLPDLRDTLYQKIMEHLQDDDLKDGVHYRGYDTTCSILFPPWGSEILPRTWGDKKFKKFRSLELSFAAIDELTETPEEDKEFLTELRMRLGRQPHINRNILLCATNPDSPQHWAYDYFIRPNSGGAKHPTRHVYYSKTRDNPFLPAWYIDQLEAEYDPRLARRMLYGEWLEIAQEVIYYAYNPEINFRQYDYVIQPNSPILMAWDFNIGVGKPMSVILGQQIAGVYHWFGEIIIHGSRTQSTLDEIESRGIFEHKVQFEIYGDAAGSHKDTRSITTDWDIIRKYLANYRRKDGSAIAFSMNVPMANPPIRERHNRVNSYCVNEAKQVRLYVYKGAKMLDKGLRLTQLKKGADLIEDDSKEYQHCTTALGYCIVYKHRAQSTSRSEVVEN